MRNKGVVLYLMILSSLYSCNERNAKVNGQNSLHETVKTSTSARSLKQPVNPPSITIGIMPLDPVDSELTGILRNEIQFFYKYNTVILAEQDLPVFAYYELRNRYIADSLLKFLQQVKPQNITYLIGVTESDICTDNPPKGSHWGVFGLGSMPGTTCVISTKRVKPTSKSWEHFTLRMTKIALHEIGHNFGIDHCTNHSCLMEDAEGTITTVDREQKALCVNCRKNKLAENAPVLKIEN